MGFSAIQYPFGMSCYFQGQGTEYFLKLSSLKSLHKAEIPRIGLSPRFGSLSSSKKLSGKIYSLLNFEDFYWEKEPIPLLDKVDSLIHLKNMTIEELKQLADEIRTELSFLTSKIHHSFQASLSVAELTVAIHHVFNAPVDKILWDIAEQTCAHKIITGRRPLMYTLRQKNDISVSTSRTESKYDPFGAGHGCNSIPAGLGKR